MKMINWLTTLVPILVLIGTFIFGIATKIYERKQNVLNQRYEELYLPFMRWLVRAPLEWLSPTHYSPKLRLALINLLLDNTQHMGEKSSSLLVVLYDAHLNLDNLDVEKDTRFITAPKRYTQLFNLMSVTLLEEGSKLAHKLRRPDLAQNILASLGTKVELPADTDKLLKPQHHSE